MPVIVTVCGADNEANREEYGQYILDDHATAIRRVDSTVASDEATRSMDYVWNFSMLLPPKMLTTMGRAANPEAWLRALRYNFRGIRFWCELKK